MKLIKLSLVLMALSLFIACDKDDDNDVMQQQFSTADVTALSSITNVGTWRVSSFIEDGDNITSVFSGFSFTFNDDGTLVVDNGTLTLNGTWQITYDDDRDDVEFEVSISTSMGDLDEDFDELSEDWYIITYSDTRIQLSEDDDDDDDDDILILERI